MAGDAQQFRDPDTGLLAWRVREPGFSLQLVQWCLAVNEWENADLVFPWIGQLSRFPGFPILFDTDGAVAERYAVQGLPTTVIIDRQGRIVYRAVGGRNFDHPDARKLILDLL